MMLDGLVCSINPNLPSQYQWLKIDHGYIHESSTEIWSDAAWNTCKKTIAVQTTDFPHHGHTLDENIPTPMTASTIRYAQRENQTKPNLAFFHNNDGGVEGSLCSTNE